MTAESPTPPRPRIVTESSGCAFPRFERVPAPVWNPQPSGANSCSSSRDFAIPARLTMQLALTTARLPRLDWPQEPTHYRGCSILPGCCDHLVTVTAWVGKV